MIDFYHTTLKSSPEALEYLEKRGLGNMELIERFRLGYANRTLAYRLAPKQYKAGAEMRTALQRVGILRDSGHEHFNGSIVVPLFGSDGSDPTARPVVGAYARKLLDNLRAGTPKHLYLPGPHRGVFNREGLEGQSEIILCEALIDALTFWSAGYRNVTSCYGVNGMTDETDGCAQILRRPARASCLRSGRGWRSRRRGAGEAPHRRRPRLLPASVPEGDGRECVCLRGEAGREVVRSS